MVVSDRVLEDAGDVGASLAAGYTLPASWYTDGGVLEREMDRIFGRFWQYAGYTGQLPNPGDALQHRIGSIFITITRADDGSLRADAARGRRAGPIAHAGGAGVPIQVDTWGPLIFVNADPSARPLAAQLGELPRIVATTGLDLSALRFWQRSTYDIRANWKVVVENYNECYHCPIAHPSFADLFDMDTYKVVTEYDYFSVQHGVVTDALREGTQKGYFDVSDAVLDAGVRDGLSGYIWPASTIDVTPGHPNLTVGMVMPVDEHRTLQVYDTFFADGVDEEQAKGMREFGQQVQSEDIVLCESVQRGLRSGFYTQGRLMVTRENGIQHFQRLVYRALTESALSPRTPYDGAASGSRARVT